MSNVWMSTEDTTGVPGAGAYHPGKIPKFDA